MVHLVIKLGGAVCQQTNHVPDLARLVQSLQASDIKVTLVHGGGPQLDAALVERFGAPKKHAGLRITPPDAASVVLSTLDTIGAELASGLNAAGLATQHVPGAAGFLHAAKKDVVDGVDLGRVGTVTTFAPPVDLDPTRVAVVTPVGIDAAGPLNVNADEAAAGIARGLRADGLILVTDVPAVQSAAGTPIHQLTPESAVALIAEGTAQGGMIPKLMCAADAVRAGVPWAWIGRLDADAILGTVAGWAPHGTSIALAQPAVAPAAWAGGSSGGHLAS